jgi:hypothetical protein
MRAVLYHKLPLPRGEGSGEGLKKGSYLIIYPLIPTFSLSTQKTGIKEKGRSICTVVSGIQILRVFTVCINKFILDVTDNSINVYGAAVTCA